MVQGLYHKLLKYKKHDMSSFHTPGHKNNFYKNINLFSLDYTELPLTDSLYEANGIIKNAEERISCLYGSEASFISSGGNTLCIQAMIRLYAGKNEKILCDRLCHRSAVSAMSLLGIEPIWIKRDFKNEIAWDIDIEDLKQKILENKDAKAFYITSPNYYGVLQDITLISKICGKYNIPVLVDNAHGAHLKFLGIHPLDLGAEATADSAHKTLPVLTGGALLHLKDKSKKEKAKSAMALFGSTSPFYPLMASIDIAGMWLNKNSKKEYKNLLKKIENLKKIAPCENFFLDGIDPTRITMNARSIGLSGFELRNLLYKFKIEPEMCEKNYVVLIATPFNSEKDWKRLENMVKHICKFQKKFYNFKKLKTNIPEKVISLSNAIMKDSEKVSLEKSVGKVAAEIVCPCPPGIPVIMPGEKISQVEKKLLFEYGISEIYVVK